MRIDLEKITPKQKLIIAKGLCDYQYIMDYWQSNDADFQSVYYEFYLKARWAVMRNPNNWHPYFEKLQSISPNDDLMDILCALKSKMEKDSFEFSLGSKLLHTRNPSVPIYDRKVREYLSEEENVNFWWHVVRKESRIPRGTTEFEKIKHDWAALRKWYDSFLPSARGKEWIAWFDLNYPAFASISDIKKVDFIIFATN